MNSESTAVVRDFAFNDDYYVVAISDVHMGFDFFDEFEKPRIPFQSFIEELESKDHKMDHFVILGDFLDLWRGDDDDVFKKGKSIVQSLVDMKGKKIGKLHYLVGNHDFNIPWYKWDGYRLRKFSRKRRELLMEFNFKGGSSTFPRPLILPEDDKTLNGKSFVFKHGHQDRYAEGLRPLYDLMCALLGGLGNETGWMASIAWKYKFYAPHLAT
ncbi:MAG: metallophosphoesterase, partial [Candidatus Thorarchaeota archaeon]